MVLVKKINVSGGIVINLNLKKLLVVNQAGTSWSLAKGHVDKDETLEEAAIREIYEESGITKLSLHEKLGEYQRYALDIYGNEDQSEFKTIHIYLFSTRQNEISPEDSLNPSAKWITLEQLENILTHKSDRYFIQSKRETIFSFLTKDHKE